MICIAPVVVYPKDYVDKIIKDVENIRRDVAEGRQPVFNNVDDLIASLEGDGELGLSLSPPIVKVKTLGRCPKPHKLLKKFDQNFKIGLS